MAAERGRSANTLSAYRRDLDGVLRVAARARCSIVADGRRRPTSSRSCRSAGAGAAPASVARQLAAIRMLHRFLRRGGHAHRRPDRRPRGRPRARRAAQAADRGGGDEPARRGRRVAIRSSLRDRALLELLYATGARISEVVRAVDRRRRSRRTALVRLYGKGSKERIVPVRVGVAIERSASGSRRVGRRHARPGALAAPRRRRGGVPEPRAAAA